MTLTSKIITNAYRESNLVAKGAVPDTDQVAEGLERLQVLVSGVAGFEVGRDYVDWPVGQDGVTGLEQTVWSSNEWAYPSVNMRLIMASSSAQIIYLHPHPSDGSRMMLIDPKGLLPTYNVTLDANGRTIEGSNTLAVSDSTAREWFYRAELGNWVLISDITGVDPEEFPYPRAFDDYFITRLAMRLNPRYGRAMREESAAELAIVQDKLEARYRQKVVNWPDPGVSSLTQGYGSQWKSARSGDVGYLRQRRLLRPPHYEG